MPLPVTTVVDEINGFFPLMMDCTSKGQIQRICYRPLITTNRDYYSANSFKGRMWIVLHGLWNIVREPYRLLKNIFHTAICIQVWTVTFFRCLFKEMPWRQCKNITLNMFSSMGAIFLRLVTIIVDISKLFVGLFHPRFAIRYVAEYKNPSMNTLCYNFNTVGLTMDI